MGWLQWQEKLSLSSNLLINLLPLLLVSFIIGSIEELIFRGVIVNFLAVDYGTWLVAIISSIIFALLHLIWEQKNTIPQLPGLWLMGLVLFYALIVDHGSLGLAIGLHSGWVLMLATVDSWEIFAYNDHFPSWLGGKKDQPLGSIIGVMVLVLTTIVLWLMSQIAIA